jgi:hypothetical protein
VCTNSVFCGGINCFLRLAIRFIAQTVLHRNTLLSTLNCYLILIADVFWVALSSDLTIVGFEIIPLVVVSWDVIPCSLLKVNRRFGGTYRLHIQDRGVNSERDHGGNFWNVLIIGLCILLRVYQSIYIETSVRNKCGCSFYCALLTLHVSAPIGGHLQVVCNTKNWKTVTVYVNGSVASVCIKATAAVRWV